MNDLEAKFYHLCAALGIPRGTPEFRFAPPRRWRFDTAYPDKMVAVELEGGTWLGNKGRHTNPLGFAKDAIKYNAAVALGWRVFRFTADMLDDPGNLDGLKETLDKSGNIGYTDPARLE